MFATWRLFQVGAGKGRAGYVGLQKSNLTQVGNVTTGEDNLMSVTLEKNSLHKNAQMLRVTAWGRTAGNANNKTLKFHFGGTEIHTTGAVAANAKAWKIEALIVRTGADAQDILVTAIHNNLLTSTFATATKDDGADQIIKITGEATATDDIIQEGMIVEALTV